MREISNTTRSFSDSQTSREDRDLTASFTGEGYQNIIEKANTVSIKKIFKMYGIRLDEINRKTRCPFKSHKGGHESTASFYFYPDTNTYCCYGCRQGSSPVDFVLNMDRCNKIKAAQKILKNFSSDIDEDLIIEKEDFHEKMKIMMQYSDAVREFRNNFSDENAFNFIEKNCLIFDKINNRYDLTNDALKIVVIKLINAISKYTP